LWRIGSAAASVSRPRNTSDNIRRAAFATNQLRVFGPRLRRIRILFRALPGSDGFIRRGAGGPPQAPDNGTAYLQASQGDSLTFTYYDAPAFSVVSVDLAGYSTVVPDTTIHIVGHRADGSTITTDVERHGIIFQTYSFGPDWSGLTRVDIPTYGWSLDNLVVSILPFAPTLRVQLTAQGVVLAWPAAYSGFTLQCSESLTPPNWFDCTNSPT